MLATCYIHWYGLLHRS